MNVVNSFTISQDLKEENDLKKRKEKTVTMLIFRQYIFFQLYSKRFFKYKVYKYFFFTNVTCLVMKRKMAVLVINANSIRLKRRQPEVMQLKRG